MSDEDDKNEKNKDKSPSEEYDAIKARALELIRNRTEEHQRRMREDPAYRASVEEDERLDEERRVKHERAGRRETLVARGCPARLVEPLLDNRIEPTPAVRFTRAWIEREQRSCILILSGPKGVGKTTAAAWALQYFQGARWIRSGELAMIGLYDAEKLEPIRRASALVLDDLGTEFNDARGAFRSILDLLINTRYDNDAATIITTNLSAGEFSTRYGARILDRVREAGLWVACGDEGLR